MRPGVIALYATIALLILAIFYLSSQAGRLDQTGIGAAGWEPVERAIGKNGTMLQGDVFKVDLPRTDLSVTIDHVRLQPPMSLDSWVSFMDMGSETMMMGDIVLTEDEIGPVLKRLAENGIDITGIHNTLIGESPHIFDLHIEARGDPVSMAKNVHEALLFSKTPFNNSLDHGPIMEFNVARLNGIIGQEGSFNDGVYQYEIPRAESVKVDGMELPGSLDIATTINFQPLPGDRAAVTGDFALTANEVNPVVDALVGRGILVVAIHNHMLSESPRLFYLHFWGTGNAYDLAEGLHAAIQQTNHIG